jgi:hypothetical protein
MKRFCLSLAFCSLLLVAGALFLGRFSLASERALPPREDVVAALLKLPAPPPPNPLVNVRRDRSDKFFDRNSPPPDDAPIEDLLDYWRHQASNFRPSRYNPKPSEAAVARMIPEIESEPGSVFKYLGILGESPAAVDMVKRVYDNMEDEPDAAGSEYEEEYSQKDRLKLWLTANSPHFVADLERKARQSGDVNGYVGNQEGFHALTKADWERARPMVDRMYADSTQPASQTLARWALYRNAMATGSAEVDRFRDELKAAVENKELSSAIRDLSLDALLIEKEWPDRDEWYFSLMSDETLVMLRPYTGLTSLMIQSPDGKYIDKMIELSKSENKVIRTAAARNLLIALDSGSPDVIRALVPWLSDPAWVLEGTEGRENIIRKLGEIKVPESVPPLIAALDEKAVMNVRSITANTATNSVAGLVYTDHISNAANAVANAANTAANVMNSAANSGSGETHTYYPLRYSAIRALARQADIRAAPALRRILPKVELYERALVIQALLASNAFTVLEQADALEFVAEQTGSGDSDVEGERDIAANAISVYGVASNANFAAGIYYKPVPLDATAMKQMLGMLLLQTSEVSDALVRELIGRIDRYEKTDPAMAEALRRMFVNWKGPAVNALLLRDLKNDKSSVMAVLKLLQARKELREKQAADVFDLRTGSPTALGISACLLESEQDYAAILAGQSSDAKAALLACGRLIRAPLAVKDAARYLDSADKRLAKAAELFLESEDSPSARSIILSRYPNSAKIMGATTAFWPEDPAKFAGMPASGSMIGFLAPCTGGQVVDHISPEGDREIQDELTKNLDLIGIYAYEENSVRIYKEKVILQWTEDESRYRERPLTNAEFRELTEYLAKHNAADLPPFLDCRDYDSTMRQLIMAGKNGGRRVFSLTERLPKFFVGLDAIFAGFRKTRGNLRYNLEKQVPGLEIIFSDDKLNAQTVWKNGTDLRVLIADKVKRRAIDHELNEQAEILRENSPDTGYNEGIEEKISAYRREREYDEFAWYEVLPGKLGALMPQPAAAEYIPGKDSLPVKSDFGNWGAKAGTLELRASSDGLYLVNGGRMSRIATGHYINPVITSNGKWAIASKYSEDEASKLVRINLATRREFVLKSDDKPAQIAIAYVAALNKVLLSDEYYDEEGGGYRTLDSGNTYWLDPDTGVLTAVKGEVGPIGQQKFRSLQPTGKPNEFWAAMPDPEKNTTSVGVYDSRLLSFKPILAIPKIAFDSMDMWVDGAANKVYFVYSGHLLALPLKQLPK